MRPKVGSVRDCLKLGKGAYLDDPSLDLAMTDWGDDPQVEKGRILGEDSSCTSIGGTLPNHFCKFVGC